MPVSNDDAWPFDNWLKLAVGRYGLSPREFWKMSVKDWLTLTAPAQGQSLGRDDFNALHAAYPDLDKGQTDDSNTNR